MRTNCLLFCALFFSHFALSQNPNTGIEVAKMQFKAKQVISPSPDAAELGKYGNVPVSLFTGTPNVSIPLFEFKGHSLNLPISLSYNSSGFKPADPSSWVGSGWALNGGGVITRSVMGNPDKDGSYFGVSNVLSPPSWVDVFDYYDYMQSVQNGTLETQPDVYYYNFPGHSGKFMLKPDYSVFKKERDLKKITPCISDNCSTSQFTIVDEQGTTYVFDQNETTRMVPNDDAGQPYVTYNFVSAWYLRLMYSANGEDVVEFEYHSTVNEQTTQVNLKNNQSTSFTYGCKAAGGFYLCNPETVASLASVQQVPPGIHIKKKFLKKINFKRFGTTIGYAELNSIAGQREDSDFPEDRQLTNVKIYSSLNGINNLIKQYDLTQSYFGDPDASGAYPHQKCKLKLDAIQEISSDVNLSSPPSHTFTYKTGFSEQFTNSLDHWGYYNASGNTSLLPTITYPGGYIDGYEGSCFIAPTPVGGGANREPLLAGSESTLLAKIEYPTGGYTTFEYELNKAKFYDHTIHDVGGVRIKQIVDYSFTNKIAVAKNYVYQDKDGITTGRAGNYPDYVRYSSNHHWQTPYSPCTTDCCALTNNAIDYTLYTMSISANSVFGLGSFQGSHIGYQLVTETTTDLSNNESLGMTVYEYSTGFTHEQDEDLNSGNLIRQSTYRNDGQLIEEKNTEYTVTNGSQLTAILVEGHQEQDNLPNYCRVGTSNTYENYGDWTNPVTPNCTNVHRYETKLNVRSYSITQQNKRIASETTKIYDQQSGTYLTSSKNYTYDNADHNYPTKIQETTTNGDKVFTELKYVIDYSDVSSPTGDFAIHIKDMKDENILTPVIEKLQYRSDAGGTNKRYISGQLTDYLYGQPVKLYFLESQPLLTSVTISTNSSGSMVFSSNYRLAAEMSYNQSSNLVQQSRVNDIPVSYIWDYDASLPIAEIKGASAAVVSYTSFETAYKGGFTFTGSPSSGTSVTGKRYLVLNASTISGPADPSKNFTVSYWRNNSGGPYAVTGSTSHKQGPTQNGWTYYEHVVTGNSTVQISGTGNIDEVRMYPAIANMTTQAFEPLVGMTSQCGPNSQLTYYEYDGLNRLLNIKDDKGDIVKNFSYNYGLGTAPTTSATSLWYNAALNTPYTKAGCTGGSIGDEIIYRIPYGKHVSTLNQADADAKATADRNANGQAYANTKGLCKWWNEEKWEWAFRDNCPPEYGVGVAIKYTVPAGRYWSLTGQTEANQLALDDIALNKQAYANANGSCECEGASKKMIGTTCETSNTKWYVGSTPKPGGGYYCFYKYKFSDNSLGTIMLSEESSNPCPGNQP